MANVAEANWQRLSSYRIPFVTVERGPDQIRIIQKPPFWKQKASKESKPARVIVGLLWFGGALVMLLSGKAVGAFLWFFIGMFPAFLILLVVYYMYPQQMVVTVTRGSITLDENGKTATIDVSNIRNIDVRREHKDTLVYTWDGIVPVRTFIVHNEEDGILLKEALSAAIALLNQGASGGEPAPGKKFEE